MELNKLIIPKGGLNVLSVFDGCSCGQVALQRAGIPVKNYFASEIDKHAIKVTMSNFPNSIQIGDVTKVKGSDLPKIDLLIGGSPCQGFSFAGKQLNFQDPRSKLFFEFVRLLDEAKPRFFFLENVKMKKEFQDIISETLLVEPIEINSNLVSAQNRKRLYWTNILGVQQPKDRGILMKDIVHEYNDELYAEDEYLIDPEKVLEGCEIRRTEKDQVTTINPRFENGKQTYQQQRVYETDGKFPTISAELNGRFNIVITEKEKIKMKIPEATKKGFVEVGEGEGVDLTFINSKTRRGRLMAEKSNCLTAANYDFCIMEKLSEYIVPFDKTLQILDKEIQRGKVGYFRTDSQANRVYYIHDKAVTLTGESGDGAAKMGQYLFGTLQKPRGFNKGGFKEDAEKSPSLTSHSWEHNNHLLFGCITPDPIEKRQNGQRFSEGKKFYTLTAQDQHGILIEGYIRKLTPIECERLQTLPDNYSSAASKAQRYKMLGNGWTVDVIVEFFKNLNIKEI